MAKVLCKLGEKLIGRLNINQPVRLGRSEKDWRANSTDPYRGRYLLSKLAGSTAADSFPSSDGWVGANILSSLLVHRAKFSSSSKAVWLFVNGNSTYQSDLSIRTLWTREAQNRGPLWILVSAVKPDHIKIIMVWKKPSLCSLALMSSALLRFVSSHLFDLGFWRGFGFGFFCKSFSFGIVHSDWLQSLDYCQKRPQSSLSLTYPESFCCILNIGYLGKR